MKGLFVFVTILVLLSGASAQAEIVNRIAAVVNNDVITLHQIDRELEKRQFSEGLDQLSGPALDALRKQALSSLIEETLVEQRVDKLGIAVTDDEVEAGIGDILMQNKLTRDELIQALSLQGMDFDVYRDNLRKQILRYKLLSREVKSKVDVSKQDQLDYFREHIEDYRKKPTIHIARISFSLPPKPTAAEVAAVRNTAAEALAKLQQGDDFFSVLHEYSAAKRADGGDMGTFGEDELTSDFERALVGLEEGQLSGLVETPENFHILKVLGRQAGSIRQFDAVKDEITKILSEKKTDEAFKTWSEELRKTAYIDIRL